MLSPSSLLPLYSCWSRPALLAACLFPPLFFKAQKERKGRNTNGHCKQPRGGRGGIVVRPLAEGCTKWRLLFRWNKKVARRGAY